MSEISENALSDCIQVAWQEFNSYAEHGHGRSKIKWDTHQALLELQRRREADKYGEREG